MKHKIVAVSHSGGHYLELIQIGKRTFIIAVDGQIHDARRKLNSYEAEEWIDALKAKRLEKH